MTRSLAARCTLIVVALVTGQALAQTRPVELVKQVYRLQRIEIPTTSKQHDVQWDDNSPPDLRITVARNGNLIGKVSETKEGWDVEFSDTKPQNRYEIDPADDATFSITLYDYDPLDPDDLILTISGIKAADFAKPIEERLSQNDPRERAVKIYFVPVK